MNGEDESEHNSELSQEFRKLLGSLTDRDKENLRKKFGIDLDDPSLEDAGKQFDITRQRLREIERKALEKLRNKCGPDDAA